MIQEIFKRPGQQKRVYADSESDTDMEAGLSDVEEEEMRAIRIARREDELADREERERRVRKEKLKREREGR
jgi:protein SPT2